MKKIVAFSLVFSFIIPFLTIGSFASSYNPPPDYSYSVGQTTSPINTTVGNEISFDQMSYIMQYMTATAKKRFCIAAVPADNYTYPYVFVVKSLDDSGLSVVKGNRNVIYADASGFDPNANTTIADSWFYYVAVPIQSSTGAVTGSGGSWYYDDGVWKQRPSGGISSGGGAGHDSRPADTITIPDYEEFNTAVTTNATLNPYEMTSYKEIWFTVGLIDTNLSNCVVYTERDLRDICENLNKAGVPCYMQTQVRQMGDAPVTIWTIRAEYNPDGYIYGYRACEFGTNDYMVAFAGVSGAAAEKKNYYTDGDTTNNTTVNNEGDTNTGKIINVTDGTFYDYSSDTWLTADSINYNPISNTYNIDHLGNTYNISYTYNYTYYVNIGATGEYTEIYNYFELPDGRSSYDLTSDEIAPLSLEFDIAPYDKQAVDTHTKGLWHLDGDTFNSSYYANDYKFSWVSGSSITYLDSNNFDGCLYLDGAAHSFRIQGPTSSYLDSFDGCTLQFRLYVPAGGGGNILIDRNSANPTDTDSLIYISGTSIKLEGGSSLASLPVGQWCDIALCLIPPAVGTTGNWAANLYLNGLFIGTRNYYVPSGSISYFFSNAFYFAFSSSPAVFRYIDEIRLVDYPVYTENFTPTPVPYDTNNVFVLPDSAVSGVDDPVVAVRTDIPIYGYQFGGVRPTFPETGLVWFFLEDGAVKGSYIYNGSYWEEVGTRVWTGSRWIPLYSYDFTQSKDNWDSITVPYDEVPTISDQGFYAWFKTEWVDFRNWLVSAFGGFGSGSDNGDVNIDVEVVPPDVDGNGGVSFFAICSDAIQSDFTVVGGFFTVAFDGAIQLTDSAVGGFTDEYKDTGGVFSFYYYEGSNIWD